MLDAWQFAKDNWDRILEWTVEFVDIIGFSTAIAIVLGVLIGIYLTGRGREQLADSILYLASITLTIPSLALFGLMVPLLNALNLPIIGRLPAAIALVLYGQLPIIRNTYIAIRDVDPAMIEAGRGMGMNESQILFKVKLPLAVPVIMAGVRNTVVLLIGIATIAVFVGAGGFGEPIWSGLRDYRVDLIIVGAAGASLFALVADFLLSQLERFVTPQGIRKGREGNTE